LGGELSLQSRTDGIKGARAILELPHN
jgi:hypothetical protein